jgi:hypothetical protein
VLSPSSCAQAASISGSGAAAASDSADAESGTSSSNNNNNNSVGNGSATSSASSALELLLAETNKLVRAVQTRAKRAAELWRRKFAAVDLDPEERLAAAEVRAAEAQREATRAEQQRAREAFVAELASALAHAD